MAVPGLDCNEPLWHPDSRNLLYACEGTTVDEGVFIAPIDASAGPRRLYSEESATVDGQVDLMDIHPSGQFLLIHSTTGGRSALIRVDLEDGEGPFEGEPLLPGRNRTGGPARFSPDGKWLSYHSDDSGRDELFVAPFRGDGSVGPSTLVAAPRFGGVWAETGTPGVFDLAFVDSQNRSLRVTIRDRSGLTLSEPRLFHDLTAIRPPTAFSLQRDGRVFGLQEPDDDAGLTRRIDLIVNLPAELSRLEKR
jgi:hypothetical protein